MTHWKKKDIERLQGQGLAATSVDMPADRKDIRYAIGIDPGLKTGIAIWDRSKKAFVTVSAVKIHTAMHMVREWTQIMSKPDAIIIRFEDARQRTWFGKAGPEQLQGAGSIKRDCKIWEDFLRDGALNFEMIPPRRIKTKVKQDWFRQVSGWQEETNSHGRDAGMLVLNY